MPQDPSPPASSPTDVFTDLARASAAVQSTGKTLARELDASLWRNETLVSEMAALRNILQQNHNSLTLEQKARRTPSVLRARVWKRGIKRPGRTRSRFVRPRGAYGEPQSNRADDAECGGASCAEVGTHIQASHVNAFERPRTRGPTSAPGSNQIQLAMEHSIQVMPRRPPFLEMALT
ncbi:hypothetical protein C8R44DRAFT_854656 [Mycena epipterygia]|nr:hypothetical protein C8R44DRAFT_854656 [Mycena epipterygia]